MCAFVFKVCKKTKKILHSNSICVSKTLTFWKLRGRDLFAFSTKRFRELFGALNHGVKIRESNLFHIAFDAVLISLLDPYHLSNCTCTYQLWDLSFFFAIVLCVLCVVRLPVCSPPPPPIPPAPMACRTQLACGRAFPLVSLAHPSLCSIRRGAENSLAIPPVADSR